MATYLILGAGKFGRLALQRLAEQDPEAGFVVIDRRPEVLAKILTLTVKPVEGVEGEAIQFLSAHLGDGIPWEWILPMIPVHVAYSWLLAGPLAGQGWEAARVPEYVEDLAALAVRGPEAEVYLSRARHLCPDDCAEPKVCPVTGEERETPLFRRLAEASRPDLPILVVASRQLAPGIGGYEPAQLLGLAEAVSRTSGPLLVATACRCHGVVHGLQRKGESRA